ncbi:MAG TPA: AraC family transcriptional regulator [Caulobacteraceae bacterium]|jgi:AraC-like DNA-binding protein
MTQSSVFWLGKPDGFDSQRIQFIKNLAELLQAARDQLERDRAAAGVSINQAASMLQSELQRHASASKLDGGPGELAAWQVRRIRAYIDDHLSETIHVKDLSDVARRSTAHFCRAFKRTFNQTPHAYLTARRLSRAKALMLEGDEPLSIIALLCGFTDQAHLSKLFRQHTGETPAAWRRRRAFTDDTDAAAWSVSA